MNKGNYGIPKLLVSEMIGDMYDPLTELEQLDMVMIY
ncbi:hypothetical protein J2Z23_002821 [Lederbergia galactosidilyticus]|nr:hypothetical protein [Lederbergia galactosidilytica]